MMISTTMVFIVVLTVSHIYAEEEAWRSFNTEDMDDEHMAKLQASPRRSVLSNFLSCITRIRCELGKLINCTPYKEMIYELALRLSIPGYADTILPYIVELRDDAFELMCEDYICPTFVTRGDIKNKFTAKTEEEISLEDSLRLLGLQSKSNEEL